MNPDEALNRLLEGNGRFVGDVTEHRCFASRREQLKGGQQPFATVVCCSDSRIVPEYIFDVDLGEIFTVITAGNVVGSIATGSVEYAVGHLNTPLLVVLGHEGCGAINAAYHGHGECEIRTIVNELAPSIEKAKKGGEESKELDEAVVLNVKAVMEKLKQSPIIKKSLEGGNFKIVGMRYTFKGDVEILE